MSGNIQARVGERLTEIGTLRCKVANEDTRQRSRLKFVFRVWPESRVTEAAEDAEFAIVGSGSEKTEKGRGEVEGWRR